jgi:hypothetical protein
MAEFPYLIALAMVERGGRRALPLCGRSQTAEAAAAADPGELGQRLALELLLRLWQTSDTEPLRRAGGDGSLLVVQMPMAGMVEQLPALKAQWLNSGDSDAFRSGLLALSNQAWRLVFERHQPLQFLPWP